MSFPFAADIRFAHLPRSPALETAIRRRISHLGQYCDDLHACRVVIEQVQRHAHQGRPFEVRVDLTINGQELTANRGQHEDAYVAVREAFDDLQRQLESAVAKRRQGNRDRQTVRRPQEAFSAVEDAAGPESTTVDIGQSSDR